MPMNSISKNIPFLKSFLLLAILFFAGKTSFAQNLSVSGTLADTSSAQSVSGAVISLSRSADTTKIIGGTQSDSLGRFKITDIEPGNYRVRIKSTGYTTVYKFISLRDSSLNLGTIFITPSGLLMKGVTINEAQIRMSQNGDTTNYNANAFKTNPDATAEDLIKKMPGVTSENGTTKVHGEEVKQVTVDGKPYFGDDPNAALKNIPADMVDQVQVFDKSSDQAQFTGFDDGKSSKTINIVTKKAVMIGQFGKVFAGYGTDDRFNAGVTLNAFDSLRRITVLGISNNINQQNFSMSDISGMLGSSGGGMGGRGGMSGRGPVRGPAANFVVGSQNGISTTHAFGLNYSEDWTPKMKASGSYFFNYSDNNNNSDLTRNYFTTNDSTLVYKELNNATTRNINHRFNFKVEYTIDSMNALTIAPRFTSQFTDYYKHLDGSNILSENVLQSSSLTDNRSDNLSYSISNSITYRHRFKKTGRTFTADLATTYNKRDGTGSFYSRNIYSALDTTITDQYSSLASNGYTINPTLTWTEAINKKNQIQFSYSYNTVLSRVDKQTFHYGATMETIIDTTLTSKYENIYTTQRGGLTWRYNGAKLQLSAGAEAQYAQLFGQIDFPNAGELSKDFINLLPNAQANYKFSKKTNLKITYRTTTNAPTISQLQNVIDNSNPLQLKVGNPDLSQTYEHTLMTHFGKTNPDKATGFFVFAYASLTNHYISNSTYIADRDTMLPEGVLLNKGSQIIRQVNLNGYGNARTFLTYSVPLKKLKSNIGFNVFGGYARTPALINNMENIGETYNAGPGLTFSSNISENLDFTLSYNGNYNIVRNSIQTQSNNNYFSHTAAFRFNWIFYKGFFVNTTLDQTFYSGLGDGYNTNYMLWNAALGYKFGKKKMFETKISAFDLLKQNTSVARSITETYVEDSNTNTLGQYFMFTFTWNIKHLKAGSKTDATENKPAYGPMGPPPGGSAPPPPPPGN